MTTISRTKSRLLGGIAVASLASAAVLGGVVAPVTPVLADAVRVEAPQAPSFADVVEAVSPAVVSVRVKSAAQPANFRDDRRDDMMRRFFEERFGNDRRFRNRERRGEERRGRRNAPRSTSQGSGFFVSDDGFIVTNNHVVENGSAFTVVMNDGKELDAKLIGTDPKTDLAVLKVEGDDFTYVSFAEGKSRVGEWVVAVGNPFGLGGTVTAGIISAANRDIGSGPYDDFLQIDAAVNKGNSGGPAFNLNGEVVGVNTAIFSPSGGNVGIAFAISARSAGEVVEDLISDGSVVRGWLGIRIQPVTEDVALALDLDEPTGTLVVEPQAGSPADEAGLKAGDVILKVDGNGVEGPKELSRLIAGFEPEQDVELDVLSEGETKTITVKLGALPTENRRAEATEAQPRENASVELDELGLAVAANGDSVFVASVDKDGAAAEQGVSEGDVLVSINGREVGSVKDVGKAVSDAMADKRKAVLFQLRSGERNRFVALPIAKG